MSIFQITNSKVIARPGFLSITEDTVTGPSGTSMHYNVHHPGAIMVAPILPDRKHAVLERQYRSAANQELLEVCAGKRDVDGEPPEQTAARELAEEMGLASDQLVKLADVHMSPGTSDQRNVLYIALDAYEAKEKLDPQSPEEAAMQFETIALDDLEKLMASGELNCAGSIVTLLLARSYLRGEYGGFVGHSDS